MTITTYCRSPTIKIEHLQMTSKVPPVMMPTISEIPAFRCGNSTVNQCSADCKPVFYSEPGTSIVTEWSLVCNRRILLTLPDSLFMVGFVLGALIGGPLTDIFGRRKNCIANSFGMATVQFYTLIGEID